MKKRSSRAAFLVGGAHEYKQSLKIPFVLILSLPKDRRMNGRAGLIGTPERTPQCARILVLSRAIA